MSLAHGQGAGASCRAVVRPEHGLEGWGDSKKTGEREGATQQKC